MTGESSTADKAASNTTNAVTDLTTAAFFDPKWQLAITIEFYFQYALIAIGFFGMAANALVLYALIAYHVRETKKRQVNLLMINQNLLDLSSCFFAVITFSIRVSNISLTGALGYFLCIILVNENSTNCMLYASIINLTPSSPTSSCLPLFVQNSTLFMSELSSTRFRPGNDSQSNDHHCRTLPEGGPSVLEQKESEALDDICGDGVRVDRRNCEHCSGGNRHDGTGRRNLPAIFRMGKRKSQDNKQRMGCVLLLRHSREPVCFLLRSHSGRHEKTGARAGGTQRRGFSTDERLAGSVQANQVEHHQDNDYCQCLQTVYTHLFAQEMSNNRIIRTAICRVRVTSLMMDDDAK